MIMYADLSLRIAVEPVHFAREQKAQTHFMGFISEQQRYLASLPLDAYIRKVISGREIKGNAEATSFAARVDAILRHADRDDPRQSQAGPGPKFWFKLRALPFRDFSRRFASTPQHTLYLPFEKNGKHFYLRLRLHTFAKDNFALGSGYRGATPPPRLFYPLRFWAWLPALLGLLIYILISWPGKNRKKLVISKLAVVVGDILSVGFFALFFSLPFFICGAVQAVGCWWPLAIFLWPFALCGLWMLKINTQYASFTVRFVPGGFRLQSLSLDKKILYNQIEKVTPAVLRNPRWLRILTGLAALFGQGGDRMRMAGQALLVSSASYGGLYFRFKDGSAFFLWIRDQWGNLIVKSLPRLLEELHEEGLFRESKPVEKKGFATDIVTGAFSAKGKSTKPPKSVRPMLLFCAVPLVVVLVFIGMDKATAARDSTLRVGAASARKPAVKKIYRPEPVLPPLKKSEIVWRKTVGEARIAMGEYVIRTSGGGVLVAGKSYQGRSDILLIRVDSGGNILWQKTYGDVGDERPAGLVATGDGGFVIAGTQGPRMYGNVYLFKVDGKGRALWQKRWGKKYTDEVAEGMARTKDGTLALIVAIKYWPTLVRFTADGRMLSRWRLTTGLPDEKRLFMGEIRSLTDGSLIVCGTVERVGARFQDAFLMKLDGEGNRIWVRTYGGEGKERVRTVRAVPGGGFLLAGFKGFSGSGAQDMWLVRTDERGNKVWEKTLKNPDDEKGTAIVALPDGEALVLGYATLPHTSVSYSTLRGIGPQGNVLWRRWLGRGVEIYAMASGGAKACLVAGEVALKESFFRKITLVVIKIRVK